MSFSFYCYACDREYNQGRQYLAHKDTKGHKKLNRQIGLDRGGMAEKIQFILGERYRHFNTTQEKEKANELLDIVAGEVDLFKFRNNTPDVYDPEAEESNRAKAHKVKADITTFCEKYNISHFKSQLVLPSIIN